MITYKITVPLPPQEVKANARPHRMAKVRMTAKYRALAWACALEATEGAKPRMERAIERSLFVHKDARGISDPDNLLYSLKAVWDGFQDAGVLADDRHLTHEPIEQTTVAESNLESGVHIEIREGA